MNSIISCRACGLSLSIDTLTQGRPPRRCCPLCPPELVTLREIRRHLAVPLALVQWLAARERAGAPCSPLPSWALRWLGLP